MIDPRDATISRLRADLEKTETDLRGERTLTSVSQQQYKRVKTENAALRAALDVAEGALVAFAQVDDMPADWLKDDDAADPVFVLAGDLRRARAALDEIRKAKG